MSNHALEKLYEKKKLLFVRDARCFFALEGSFAKLNGVNTNPVCHSQKPLCDCL